MLARTSLGDHAMLSHPLREQGLADRAVDLVGAGVRKVLALQQDATQPDGRREPRRVGERRRTAHPVAQQAGELALERGIGARLEVRGLELAHRGHERLRQVLAPELAEPAFHTVFLLASTSDRSSALGSGARMSAVPTSTASTRLGSASTSAGVAMPDSATSSWPGRAS